MFFVIILYALLALAFVFAKNALCYATPCFLIGFRMITAGLMLLMYCALRDKKHLRVQREDRWSFVKAAFFHIYCAFVLEFWAMQYLPALKVNIIYSSTPFIAAILSYWLLNERLTWQRMVAIVIGFSGLLPVLFLTSLDGQISTKFVCMFIPEVVLFGAVISAIYAWFLIKELMSKGYHLGFVNGLTMCIGGVMSMLTSWMFEDIAHAVSDWPSFLGWVFLLIIVANILFYNLYAWLLRSHSITFITFAGFLSPVFGVLYESFFMGRAVSWYYVISIVCIAFGLYIFYCSELKKGIR